MNGINFEFVTTVGISHLNILHPVSLAPYLCDFSLIHLGLETNEIMRDEREGGGI